MRIVEDTPSRLVMRDRTLWVSWLCFAVVAIAAVRFALAPGQLRPLIPGALFLAFGLAFLRATDVTFDKGRRTCAVRRRDIARVTRTELAFGDIIDVRVEPSPGGDDSGAINCRLSLVTAAAAVPLTASYAPSLERYEAMRETLVDLLFAERPRPAGADPVEVLTRSGRSLDAVMLLRHRDGLDLTMARDRVAKLRETRGL